MSSLVTCIGRYLSALGTGPYGLFLIFRYGFKSNFTKLFICSATFTSAVIYFLKEGKKIKPKKSRLVLITGCDTGIGYSFAQHCFELGFTVLAGVLNLNSIGAKQLKNLSNNQIITIKLDVTDSNDIQNANELINNLTSQNYDFYCLINNAGIMVFGEYEWLPWSLITQQIKVNLVGAMQLTHELLPIIRQSKGRIINIGSHCGFSTLPGLTTYGSSKAAMHAWNDGLRVEIKKFGVYVVLLVPGNFTMQSQIMSRIENDSNHIAKNLSIEQLEVYKDYFNEYYNRLKYIPVPKQIEKIDDDLFYKKLENALLLVEPKPIYKHEPWSYMIYHFFFKYSPIFLRDYLALKMVGPPKWKPK